MKGTVVKRGKKYAICYYIGKNSQGKWMQKWESGYITKREAERVLRARVEAVEASFSSNLSCSTVSAFLNYWLDNYCAQNLAPNTLRGYRTNVEKHICPVIGDILLVKLTPKHIQDLYSELLRRGLSGTSVRYVHNNLHKAFDYGVKLQALPRNPAEMVTPPRAERFEANTLTPTEVVRLLETSRGTEVFWPILLAVSLGLRRGEVLALRWKDVDLDTRQVFIRHSARCENLDVFTISETKTKSSRRLLCLPAYVADALRTRRELLEERRRELGATYNEQDLVCFRETGTPFTSNALRHQYLKVLEHAGLPAIRFHDLRHTFANAMLGANVPEKVVSAVLGHSGIQVTMDTYSHVNTAMQEKAVETMDKILNNLC